MTMKTFTTSIPIYLDAQIKEVARATKYPLQQLLDLSHCLLMMRTDSSHSILRFPLGLTGGEAITVICHNYDLAAIPVTQISTPATLNLSDQALLSSYIDQLNDLYDRFIHSSNPDYRLCLYAFMTSLVQQAAAIDPLIDKNCRARK